MTDDEIAEIEGRLKQGEVRPEDVRRLIHAVKDFRSQLDEVQRVLSDFLEKKRH